MFFFSYGRKRKRSYSLLVTKYRKIYLNFFNQRPNLHLRKKFNENLKGLIVTRYNTGTNSNGWFSTGIFALIGLRLSQTLKKNQAQGSLKKTSLDYFQRLKNPYPDLGLWTLKNHVKNRIRLLHIVFLIKLQKLSISSTASCRLLRCSARLSTLSGHVRKKSTENGVINGAVLAQEINCTGLQDQHQP